MPDSTFDPLNVDATLPPAADYTATNPPDGGGGGDGAAPIDTSGWATFLGAGENAPGLGSAGVDVYNEAGSTSAPIGPAPAPAPPKTPRAPKPAAHKASGRTVGVLAGLGLGGLALFVGKKLLAMRAAKKGAAA